ncbi:hypothetical protein [Thauera humireducens]
MKTISSRDNPLVKRLHALASSRARARKLGEHCWTERTWYRLHWSVRAA